ncbi:MAG: hypothetical protein DHS20C11_26310 [Lysobacteraceae bacterium]|nr:MAG: hypothetical protein DHS20C11_26310 [Xanthomonadaceae bacterium]
MTATKPPIVEALKAHASIVVAVGAIMLILGIFSVAAPMVAGASVAIMVGTLLTIGGVGQCLLAFRAGAFGRGLLVFIVGLLMTVVGINLLTEPLAGMVSLTVILIIYLVASGLLESVMALQMRPHPGWGISLLNGLITLLLGALLWLEFPWSGAWAIGILLGIKLIVSGWALIFVGRNLKPR